VRETPPSPSKIVSNSKTGNSIFVHADVNGTYYYSDESYDDMPMSDFVVTNIVFDDIEEYVFDILYGNALDNGPLFLDSPSCATVATSTCEDKNDIIDVCDGTLIH
jgi:hypothetical protein